MKKNFFKILFSLILVFISFVIYADESDSCEPSLPPPDSGDSDYMPIEIEE